MSFESVLLMKDALRVEPLLGLPPKTDGAGKPRPPRAAFASLHGRPLGNFIQ